MLCLVYKSLYKTCLKAFEKLATPKSTGKYTLCSESVLFEPKCKTNFRQFSVDCQGPHLWKNLILNGVDLSEYDYFPLFKCKLKQYLLTLPFETVL